MARHTRMKHLPGTGPRQFIATGRWQLGRWCWRVEQAIKYAMPGRCSLCLATSGCLPLCDACYDDLPWNRLCCPVCAEPLRVSPPRPCRQCLAKPPGFEAAWAPLLFQKPVTGLIHAYKFHANPRAGYLLSRLAMPAFLDACSSLAPTALIPVPLGDRRARQRGFNQAQWLANRLSHWSGVAVVAGRRVADTQSQRQLGRVERASNLLDAFSIDQPLSGKVLLIDDVMTTGATLASLAQAARQAGADAVGVLALARTPPKGY